MRFSSLKAGVGLLTVTGNVHGSEPKPLDLDALLSPGGYSRTLGNLSLTNNLSLQNQGFSFGNDGVTPSNQMLLALMSGKSGDPAFPGTAEPKFPRFTENGGAVIDDFEGDMSNWEVTGRSFDSARPFDGAAYNKRSQSAQISGFQGKQFAFSFGGRNENTGKAVSKEFVIDPKWSRLSFEIMGGTTNSTRLDLVIVENGVDKAVKTASGDGTLTFTNKSWTIPSNLKGKTAKLVITDDSTASSYGFIGVDNIKAEVGGLAGRATYSTVGLTLRDAGITSTFFLQNSTERFSFPAGKGEFSPVHNVGVSAEEHERLINAVAVTVYRDRSLKFSGDFNALSKALTDVSSTVMKDSGYTPQDYPVLANWLVAEAIGAFAISRVRFAHDQVVPGFDPKTRYALNEPSKFMSLQDPKAVCSGFSRLTYDLSKRAGLKVYHIDGYSQQSGRTDWSKPNHGWLFYDFGSGIRVPADFQRPTTWSDSTDFTKLDLKVGWRALIKSVRDWEIFQFRFFQFRLDNSDSPPPNLQMTSLSFEEWQNCNTNKSMLNKYFKVYGDLKREIYEQLVNVKLFVLMNQERT